MSGSFRRLLTYLINDMHNSNLLLRQITLSGEIINEGKFCVLGFVSIDVVNFKKDMWFSKLGSEQTPGVDEYLDARLIQFRMSLEETVSAFMGLQAIQDARAIE